MHFTVHTWQTDPYKEDKGHIRAAVNTKIKDENVGHAAITLVLPVNEETKKLVEKYCGVIGMGKPKIPFYIVNHEVKKADLGTSVSDISVSEATAYSGSEFHIYFSFWPSTGDTHFLSDPIRDGIDERQGRNFYKNKENINRDLLTSTEITYQEVKNDKGKIVNRYALSPDLEVKRGDIPLDKRKEAELKRFQDIPQQLLAISQQIDKKSRHKLSEEQQKEFIKYVKKLERGAKRYFPDLDVKNDIAKLENFDFAKDDPDILLDVVEKYLLLSNALTASIPYYAELFVRTKGDYGDNTQTVQIPEHEGVISVENMLFAMSKIAEEKRVYKFASYNCSTAANEVIQTGLVDSPELAERFSDVKPGLLPQTPQILMRNTRGLASAVERRVYKEREEKRKGKPVAKEPSPKTRSMAIVVKRLEKAARETKTVEINREKTYSRRHSENQISSEELIEVVDRMNRALQGGKIPLVNPTLSGLIESKNSELKRVKEHDSEEENFLKYYSEYIKLVGKAYEAVQSEQKQVRSTGLEERKANQFIALIQAYGKQGGDKTLKEIEKMLSEFPQFKELKIQNKSIASYAKECERPKLKKLFTENVKQKDKRKIKRKR